MADSRFEGNGRSRVETRFIAPFDRDALSRGRRFPYLTVVAGPVVGILAAVLTFAFVPDIMRDAGLL